MLSTCQLHISLTRTAQIYLELHVCVELHTKMSLNVIRRTTIILWSLLISRARNSASIVPCVCTVYHKTYLLRLGSSVHLGTLGSNLSPFQPVDYGIFKLLARDLDSFHFQVLLKRFAARHLRTSFPSSATFWSPCHCYTGRSVTWYAYSQYTLCHTQCVFRYNNC